MKLVCTSDLHGNLNQLDFRNCDLVIIAGDFSKTFGFKKWHIYEQMKWIKNKFIPFLSSYHNTKFVVIPGNHDLCFDLNRTFVWQDLNWTIHWPENVSFLLDSYVEVNGLKIYGTPWVPIISYNWAFEGNHNVLLEKFRKIPENLDILITHTPPRILDFKLDYSEQTKRGPFGSSELAQVIFEKKPKYVFCGHIHSGNHNLVEFEGSKIYNVSRLDENYEIAYKPLYLEI